MKRPIFAILFLLASTTAAHAQSLTVGEVLDRGGRKLTKPELQSLVTGATVAGTQGTSSPTTT